MLTDFAYWFRKISIFEVGSMKGTPLAKPVLAANPHNDIRDTITDFLADCNLPFHVTQYDHEFHDSCCDVARSKGYPMGTGGEPSLLPFIPGGVVIATTAYAHLDNKSTQIFIALYTAFLIYFDDVFQHDVEHVYCFNERFISRQAQGDPVLDGLASLLHEFPEHFGRVISNMMVTSTLNFVTGLLLEHKTQDMLVSPDAHNYTTFARVMSGASETYALFVFPPQVPMQSYIQALPEQMVFLNNGNDVLSFYKEDLAGETVNYVSNLAKCQGVSKIESLRGLSKYVAACHAKVLQILSPYREAYTAYAKFSQGYIEFHASLSRYRLSDLLS